MTRPSKRGRLLDAIGQAVSRYGTTGLTLDAVAADPGESKGGVLHHFDTKAPLDPLVRLPEAQE